MSVGKMLQDILRSQDTLIRWGGEEFVICLPNAHPKEGMRFLNRLIATAPSMRPDGTPQTMSVGVAGLPDVSLENFTDALALADERMYVAKEAGKNQLYDGINKHRLIELPLRPKLMPAA